MHILSKLKRDPYVEEANAAAGGSGFFLYQLQREGAFSLNFDSHCFGLGRRRNQLL